MVLVVNVLGMEEMFAFELTSFCSLCPRLQAHWAAAVAKTQPTKVRINNKKNTVGPKEKEWTARKMNELCLFLLHTLADVFGFHLAHCTPRSGRWSRIDGLLQATRNDSINAFHREWVKWREMDEGGEVAVVKSG